MSPKNYILSTCLSLLVITSLFAQNKSAQEVLELAIAYHDPEDQWSRFNDTLNVTMTTPKNPDRHSTIVINLPKDYFKLTATRDTVTSTYILDGANCSIRLNGSSTITAAQRERHNLNCERALLYKNYYSYLYGLPMKLKDPGTLLDNAVVRKQFKGKDYVVLKVSYEASVGSDIWYFYFDPKTYAMEVYQFYKTDKSGNVIPRSGEYILLSDLSIISGIKMPKVRAWYYNKDDGYLGTDTLTN